MGGAREQLTEPQRRQVFAALVEAQDMGLGVKASREAITQRFGVDAETVAEVEEEGLEKEWPPLGKK